MRQSAADRRAERRGAIGSSVAALALIIVFLIVSHGLALDVTFVPAMVLALALHLWTTNRRPPDPERVLPVYLVAVAWQLLHFTEEFVTGFGWRWPVQIFHAEPYSPSAYLAINMISAFGFIMGGLAIYRGWRVPLIIVWFFAIMGTVGNAIGHVVWCAIVRGYFPGLWTSLGYWVLGPILIKRLLESRAHSRATVPRIAPAGALEGGW